MLGTRTFWRHLLPSCARCGVAALCCQAAAQHPFHPKFEQAIVVYMEAIAKDSWEMRSRRSIGESDENFFNLMPRLFLYKDSALMKSAKDARSSTSAAKPPMALVTHKNVLQPRAMLMMPRTLLDLSRRRPKMASARTARVALGGDVTYIRQRSVCLSNECASDQEQEPTRRLEPAVSNQGVWETLFQKIVVAFPDERFSTGQISHELRLIEENHAYNAPSVSVLLRPSIWIVAHYLLQHPAEIRMVDKDYSPALGPKARPPMTISTYTHRTANGKTDAVELATFMTSSEGKIVGVELQDATVNGCIMSV
ncbi:hypothetical protein BD310DRAFT_998033 [Dichomitus squalens]|uniref:Uncharacterized protein n=1 Tax=Dichomitus squalens TaxID=114155 RepID=A0A4Q9PGI9_9APHY|nr:hypothetical protein BD310DRAFT_998033 [Dichomitus squalens]